MTSRIVSLKVHRVSVPLLRPFVTAQRAATVHDAVLVQLRDADGRSGWGEAPCSWRVTGESPESVTAAASGPLAACVIGADPLDYPDVAARVAGAIVHNAAARSAVECGLLDLAAQQQGVTLAEMLGGTPAQTAVLTDMTIAAGETDAVVATALAHVADGFTTLKIKAGAGGDDRATVAAVRAAVGPDIRLRVDANQGWSARQAVEIIGAWESDGIGVDLVEQPVAARAIDDLAFVTSRVATPIMADEAVWTMPDLLQVLRHSAADFVNLKLAKTGGPLEALRMAAAARENGIGVLVGSMMESQVGIAAAASLAAALDPSGEAGHVHDLDAGLWLRSSPVAGGSHYEGSRIHLSPQPGLGIGGLS